MGGGFKYLNYRVLFFPFARFPLRGFEGDFVRLVSSNKATISETIHGPLLHDVVWIEEAFSDRDNADMNSRWWRFFSFALCQWLIPRSAFHDGRRPGTTRRRIKVPGDEVRAGAGESASEFILSHGKSF